MLSLAFCVNISAEASATDSIVELEKSEYYGRNALLDLPNSENLIFAYDCIVSGVEKSEERISLSDSSHYISVNELKTVFNAYYNDYPQHFWVLSSYTYYFSAEKVTSIAPTYIFTGEELKKAKEDVEAVVLNLLSGITSSMSEYEREKLIHDRICNYVSYDLEASNIHNIYGALVSKKAVCDGYSKAFQYLLYRAGIQSHIVSGTAAGGGHAWNLVRIDGKYYYTDITWDDQGESIYNAYLNITTSMLLNDHVIGVIGYALPECTSVIANYYVINNSILDPLDVDKLANIMLAGNGTAEIYVNADYSEFVAWINNNLSNIASKIGIQGSYYSSLSKLGNSYIICITESNGVSLSGKIKSSGRKDDDIIISLIPSGSSEAAYKQTVKGNNAEYSFREIEPGDYTIVINKNKHIEAKYDISINTNTIKDFSIYHQMDINQDGDINGYEMIVLTRYLSNWNVSINESYFDLNGDGKFSGYELIIFTRYFSGWNVNIF